jgi:hypothetical protein
MSVYIRAEEIRIEGDEDGYSLVAVDSDSGKSITIGVQDIVFEFYAAVQREIRPYILEAESARTAVASGMSREEYLGTPDLTGAYELDDPKHPTYHERMSGLHDDREVF